MRLKSSTSQLLLVLLAFITPVLIAKMVLSLHWYQGGVTNQGQLFEPTVSLEAWQVSNPYQGKWQLLYVPNGDCIQALSPTCQQRLQLLEKSKLALGRKQDRVQTSLAATLLTSTSHLETNVLSLPNDLWAQLPSDSFVIVDPLGNFVLYYPELDDEQLLLQGKAMLRDLQKLLKLSRIG